MGKLVFGMMQSLDGYIAGTPAGPQLPAPGKELHRHFNDHVRGLAGILYGAFAGQAFAGSPKPSNFPGTLIASMMDE
jgi:hypothetical protein